MSGLSLQSPEPNVVQGWFNCACYKSPAATPRGFFFRRIFYPVRWRPSQLRQRLRRRRVAYLMGLPPFSPHHATLSFPWKRESKTFSPHHATLSFPWKRESITFSPHFYSGGHKNSTVGVILNVPWLFLSFFHLLLSFPLTYDVLYCILLEYILFWEIKICQKQ